MITNSIVDVTPIVRSLIKDKLQSDGQNVFSFDSDYSFSLSESFVVESSIVVYVNGEAIDEADFEYNADTNKVTIDFTASGDDLNAEDIVLITYNYYKKYSDNEISDYIESSFSYFVQHKYKKIFALNDDRDMIIAINDLDPLTDELYFIALITAIIIDPQNIEINTPEFKLTANRSNSDQEQISRTFQQWKRFVGTVTFNIIEDITN